MIRVESGARLHFGLLSFGGANSRADSRAGCVEPPARGSSNATQMSFEPQRRFGGVGVMVDQPGVRLEISAADDDQIVCDSAGPAAGPFLHHRLAKIVGQWREAQVAIASRTASPADNPSHNKTAPHRDSLRQGATSPHAAIADQGIQLRLLDVPPPHCGFGSGTQLALAVATGLNRLFDLPTSEVAMLANQVKRGRRSAVGTYGFAHGGLIVDRGKLPGEPISPLACRLLLPDDWRFVIACDITTPGISGARETEAFAQLPAVPETHSREMFTELRERMLPAVANRSFTEFARSLWRYGSLAGECFSLAQGGDRFSSTAKQWVDFARAAGFEGVGQTSWGPAVFVATPNETSAKTLVDEMRAATRYRSTRFWIASPLSHGAIVRTEEA